LKVVWSPLAVERAHEEARFIADDKPAAALHWLDGLFQSTDQLARFLELGRIVPEIGLRVYREITYGSHRVIYRVEKSLVSILTVRRSRQQLQRSDLLP
jgi:toxin ParE1/3/4